MITYKGFIYREMSRRLVEMAPEKRAVSRGDKRFVGQQMPIAVRRVSDSGHYELPIGVVDGWCFRLPLCNNN